MTNTSVSELIREKFGELYCAGGGGNDGAFLPQTSICTEEVIEELTQLTKQVQSEEQAKHIEIYRWLCGYYDFPERQKGMGAYWWRSYLMEKLKQIGINSLQKEQE